jgi:hypothetical protein
LGTRHKPYDGCTGAHHRRCPWPRDPFPGPNPAGLSRNQPVSRDRPEARSGALQAKLARSGEVRSWWIARERSQGRARHAHPTFVEPAVTQHESPRELRPRRRARRPPPAARTPRRRRPGRSSDDAELLGHAATSPSGQLSGHKSPTGCGFEREAQERREQKLKPE